MKQRVYLVGVGMGARETMTLAALDAVQKSDCLIGALRMLEGFRSLGLPSAPLSRAEEIAAFLALHPEYQTVSVLLSGDIGFYSGAKRLRERLEADRACEIVPFCGISAPIYFCAALGLSWDAVFLASAHGRDCDVVGAVRAHPDCFFLTGGSSTPSSLCQALCDAGLGGAQVSVGERLSYPDERITRASAQELSGEVFDPLSAVLVQRGGAPKSPGLPGIADEQWIRDPHIPMTKREVRIVSVTRLLVPGARVLWDVGAGTGSVSVELALCAPEATVYAVEREPAALALLEQNRAKFGADNLLAVAGEAPAALEALPAPDCVFLGGTSGKLDDILALILRKNPAARLVANVIALESVSATLEAFERFGLVDLDAVQLSVSRIKKAGAYHLPIAQNPVTILSGRGAGR
ncbi:MAG: precorrin-6y C5,15-methyltransferase (decarboxylating) subunit CbiE [Oscillospiraceae bacterium]